MVQMKVIFCELASNFSNFAKSDITHNIARLVEISNDTYYPLYLMHTQHLYLNQLGINGEARRGNVKLEVWRVGIGSKLVNYFLFFWAGSGLFGSETYTTYLHHTRCWCTYIISSPI